LEAKVLNTPLEKDVEIIKTQSWVKEHVNYGASNNNTASIHKWLEDVLSVLQTYRQKMLDDLVESLLNILRHSIAYYVDGLDVSSVRYITIVLCNVTYLYQFTEIHYSKEHI